MHKFTELITGSVNLNLKALDELSFKLTKELESSSPSVLIKSLQMIELQKSILAVGMFSMFDAILQEELNCKNGFKEARLRLDQTTRTNLKEEFDLYCLAINVLKHGKGTSFDKLKSYHNPLPFLIKIDSDFIDEGDISEISTLIKVDNKFIMLCVNIIENVSKAIQAGDENIFQK